MNLPQRLSFIHLGVADLPRSIAFYRDGLGLLMKNDGKEVAHFDMGGSVLALCPMDRLAEEAGEVAADGGFSGVTLACNVASKADVDSLLVRAKAIGSRKIVAAVQRSWGGYSGYFADPDGHLWEICFNPYERSKPQVAHS